MKLIEGVMTLVLYAMRLPHDCFHQRIYFYFIFIIPQFYDSAQH